MMDYYESVRWVVTETDGCGRQEYLAGRLFTCQHHVIDRAGKESCYMRRRHE